MSGWSNIITGHKIHHQPLAMMGLKRFLEPSYLPPSERPDCTSWSESRPICSSGRSPYGTMTLSAHATERSALIGQVCVNSRERCVVLGLRLRGHKRDAEKIESL